ncbi:MAG TPA: tetratricopeptide repeat protein, partial [Kofleriaceae bacterium]|nr:tetratricopeptide repeat protein [Kofleriaceae bacterium]
MPAPSAPSASGAFRVDHHISTAAELLRRNRIAEAKEELEAALEIDAESVRAQALYGLALFRGGQFEQARPIYEKLTTIAGDDAAYHLNLGLVRLKLGDADGAVTALERSRELDPSQGRAVNYLGLAYARGGRFAEAYRAFLVAGQVDLAREIADNLSAGERSSIEASLRRPAAGG